MAHWKWNPSFSVGIEVIDTQHKQIIQYINDLNIAFSYKKMYIIEEVLNNLINYTESHFFFEENLMQEAGYPMLTVHKQSHQAFIQRINFFKERHENGENIAKQLKMELQFWLINHIKNDDTDYTKIVQKMLLSKDVAELDESSSNSWIKKLLNKYF